MRFAYRLAPEKRIRYTEIEQKGTGSSVRPFFRGAEERFAILGCSLKE